MTELSFHLSDDFIEPYTTKKVDWGFVDAGGNSLGEITFLRTYSRKKADGSKEKWHEVCRRVVEGMFSIQKDWCKDSRLPWNDRKAQASAQEAYDRLFDLKWTPPGRGLWVMGTPLVNEQKNSAALQNCFTGSTTFVTSDGVRRLDSAVGETVEVMTDKGWANADVQSFGVQPVQRITFAPAMATSRGEGVRAARSNLRHVVEATPDHRWLLSDGTETTDLQPGEFVPSQVSDVEHDPMPAGLSPVISHEHSDEYLHGWRHGYIFGDGNVSSGSSRRFEAPLCGDDSRWEPRFPGGARYIGSHGYPICVVHSDNNLKALPDTGSPTYLSGLIDGWMAADGSPTASGSVALASISADAHDWLNTHAAAAGWLYVGHSDDNRDTNFGPRTRPLTKHVLTRAPRSWVVKSIEPLPVPEEVFCAVVPSTGSFTLSQGIYTGNCAFVSSQEMSKYDPSKPYRFLMEASMLGIGVGFDSLGVNREITVQEPQHVAEKHVIPDTREGWVEVMAIVVDGYLRGGQIPQFDYSEVRPEGAEIKTFGGTAAGPEPLMRLVNGLEGIFKDRLGEQVDTKLIADIGNLIGVCVVSGNVRRSAELFMGSIEDEQFLGLKDYKGVGAGREDWGWMSNNSVAVNVGDDLSPVIEGISRNGEPGVIWMDVSRQFGRLEDPRNDKDYRAAGYNPCAEQTLESMECCTLVETYLNRHESLEDYQRTLKYAYLYAKTVTLLPTHWAETNAIMQRNRRIGTSMSGIANFADDRGLPELKKWMNESYPVIQSYDTRYSEWLGVRESIKTTTVKPSGTVSILAGESPGAHWGPGDEYYYRLIRFSNFDPMVEKFRSAGYKVETDVANPETTVVVYFPMRNVGKRTEQMVSIFEKVNLAATAQRYWSDNSVSVTVSFDAETEQDDVATVLHMYEGQLKTISFLPQGNDTYPQMPYTSITEEDYTGADVKKVNLNSVYKGKALEAVGEAYCTTDQCLLPEPA